MNTSWPHWTVLRDEVAEFLVPQPGGVFVDGTLGMGGHTEALLERGADRVVGIDRDPAALNIARERLAAWGDRVTMVHGTFDAISEHLAALGIPQVDGIVVDLGVSSLQLDEAERGFSFRSSGPVDMRMDTTQSETADEVVNTMDANALATLIFTYGEERHSRRIARAIVAGRPWTDTESLAEAIADAVPKGKPEKIHPATRTFQAIRIHVNDELGQVERFLPEAVNCLSSGGRLSVIAFHSLEDRIVKRFLAFESGRTSPRDAYGHPVSTPRLRPLPKLVRPSADDPNPRARSAKLRCAVRS